jgi:hypothetical protein
MQELDGPIRNAFGLDTIEGYFELISFSDVIVARQFEGFTYNLSRSDFHKIEQVGQNYFIRRMSSEALQKWITKVLSRPINQIKEVLDSFEASRPLTNELLDHVLKEVARFTMYSAHDSTVAPVWEFIDAINFSPEGVPYATSV